MSLVGIRRTKTVCDVRPEEVERDGRPKKRNIFSKMLRSFSRTIKVGIEFALFILLEFDRFYKSIKTHIITYTWGFLILY